MKVRKFSADNVPFVSDLSSYRDHWVKWWTSCQPAWRRGKGWPLPREDEGTTNWVKVGARGQNGLFLIVLSTAWWAYSIRSEKEWAEFDEAVDDLKWVIGQVTVSLMALQTSRPSIQPVSPKKTPESSVPWMTREAGKRQPKPSRKLVEARGG